MSKGKSSRRKSKLQEVADKQSLPEVTPEVSASEVATEHKVAAEEQPPEIVEGAVTVEPTPEIIEVTEEVVAPEVAEEPVKVTKPRTSLAPKDPDGEEMSLEAASSSMVDGYKESWLPAIRAKAKSMGVGESATKRVWRGVFIAWGGVNILR